MQNINVVLSNKVYTLDRAQPQEIVEMEIEAGIEPFLNPYQIGTFAKLGFFGEYDSISGKKLIYTDRYASAIAKLKTLVAEINP